MAYLNVSPDFFGHPKTRRLEGLLGKGADVLPIRLWSYCSKYCPADGRLKNLSEGEIESALGWWGKPGEAVEALKKVGFLDHDGNSYASHGWREHQGHLVAFKKRASEAAKARWKRARSIAASNAKTSSGDVLGGCPLPVHDSPVPPKQNNKKEKECELPAPHSVFPEKQKLTANIVQGGDQCRAFVDLWHESCPSLPRVSELTAGRRTKIAARLQSRPLQQWRIVFESMEQSNFFRGQNDRGWKGNLDWVIKNEENALYVLEGKYSNGKTKAPIGEMRISANKIQELNSKLQEAGLSNAV